MKTLETDLRFNLVIKMSGAEVHPPGWFTKWPWGKEHGECSVVQEAPLVRLT